MPGLKEMLAELLGEDQEKLTSILDTAKKEAEALANETTKGLKNKRDELLESVKELKAKQVPDGLDLSGYETYLSEKDKLEQEKREAEEARLIASQNWDKLKDQMNDSHQKAIDALKNQNSQELSLYKQALEKELIENVAIKAIDKEKGNSTLLLPHIKPFLKTEFDEATKSFNTVIVDEKGGPKLDPETGNPYTVKKLISDFKSNDAFAGAFPQSSGSGVQPNTGGSPSSINNPFKKGDTYNLTEQAKLIKANPTLAASMRKAAEGK